MRFTFIFFVLFLPAISWQLFPGAVPDEGDYRHLYPIVCLSVQIRPNYDHTIPYFFGFLEEIQYPKDRMHVALFVENNSGEDNEIISDIQRWLKAMSPQFFLSAQQMEAGKNWRETALIFSRRKSCNFALIADTNIFLMKNALRQLIDQNVIVISPLLNSPFNKNYSNARGLLGDDFVERKQIESTRVYYSIGPLLINLKLMDSSYLSFDSNNVLNYNGNGNPIDVFAFSAFAMDIPIVINNAYFYGYFIDPWLYKTPQQHRQILNTFIANLISNDGATLSHSNIVPPKHVTPTKFGVDAIFVINLERRPKRLQKMSKILQVMGLDYEVVSAVDGQKLSLPALAKLGVKLLPGYKDPIGQRPIKFGEIGCFLSHYLLWRRVVDENLDKVIILEDDVRFTGDAMPILNKMFEDLVKTQLEWDFIYLGRKKVNNQDEDFFVTGHQFLSTVGYSYWTLGYLLSNSGARKLLAMKPLKKLIALDEFLPIAYGKHPNIEWTKKFVLNPEQKLKAFTLYPVAVEPERFTNQAGYISDTEDSTIIANSLNNEVNDTTFDESKLVFEIPLNVAQRLKNEL